MQQPATQSSNQPLGPQLGGSRGNWRHRLLHFHLPLALASALAVFLWMSLPPFQAGGHQAQTQTDGQMAGHHGPTPVGTPPAAHHSSGQTDNMTPPMNMNQNGDQAASPDERQNRLLLARFTTATGYVALGLLALTLLIGPANLLLRRRTPISSYLARDVGTWAAIVSVIHVGVGFFVHGLPGPIIQRILFYFFAPDGSPLTNAFGLGNWTGLAATVIVVGLLAISSDFALRKLKAGPWKRLQRLNYALFALVILHAIYYGALLRVTSPTTTLLGLTVILVFVGQMIGIWLWRRRHARTTGRQPIVSNNQLDE